jgi:CRP-like cAMP-binding protein
VIHQIGLKRIADFKIDLIAQLFNPDRLIREIAGWALHQIDPKEFLENSARLEEDQQRWLNRAVLKKSNDTKLMLFEKAVFFQSINVFEGIPGLTLSYLADIAKEVKIKKDEFLSTDERSNNDFFIIYQGSVQYYEKSRYVCDFVKEQFIGEMLSAPGFINSNLLVAKEDSLLLKINKDQFYELLSDNVKLADRVLLFV